MLSLTWKKNPKKLDLEGLPKNLDISIGDKFTQIFIPTNGYNVLSLERPGSANVYSGRFQFMIKVASPYFLTLDRRFVAADSHSSTLAETGIQLPKAACLDALSQPCETKAPTADTSGHISGTFVISIAKLQAAVSHFTDISKGHKCTIILLACVVFFLKTGGQFLILQQFLLVHVAKKTVVRILALQRLFSMIQWSQFLDFKRKQNSLSKVTSAYNRQINN